MVEIEFDLPPNPAPIEVHRSGGGWLMLKIDGTEVHIWCHSGEAEHQFMVDLIRALEGQLNVVSEKKPKRRRK